MKKNDHSSPSIRRRPILDRVPFLKFALRPLGGRDYIAVFGSVHLDVIGRIRIGAHKLHWDVPGEAFFSVGGTAYNIASHLARDRYWVMLVSKLKRDSYLTEGLLKKAWGNSIETQNILKEKDCGESAFIAHMDSITKELVSAVSCMAIETETFPAQVVDRVLNDAKVVVIDFNLSDETILGILENAHSRAPNIPVVGAVVSQEKVKKLREIRFPEGHLFEMVVGNVDEIALLVSGYDTGTQDDERIRARNDLLTGAIDTEKLLNVANARHVLVTGNKEQSGRNYIYCRGAAPIAFDAVVREPFGSFAGCGDAITAGAVAVVLEQVATRGHVTFERDQISRLSVKCIRYLQYAAGQIGATMNSALSLHDRSPCFGWKWPDLGRLLIEVVGRFRP